MGRCKGAGTSKLQSENKGRATTTEFMPIPGECIMCLNDRVGRVRGKEQKKRAIQKKTQANKRQLKLVKVQWHQ